MNIDIPKCNIECKLNMHDFVHLIDKNENKKLINHFVHLIGKNENKKLISHYRQTKCLLVIGS